MTRRHPTTGTPGPRALATRPAPLVVLLVGLVLAAWLAPVPQAAAQDESGQFIEFPFRDSDGRIVWYARAQRGEHMYGLQHPLRPDAPRTHAYVFERHPDVTGREAERTAGVRFVLPLRRPENAGPDDASQVIVVMADTARFFPDHDLLEFETVRMEVRFSQRSARSRRLQDEISESPDDRSGGLGPELTTRRLFIRWEKRPGPQKKYAHIFSDADFTLNAPEQDVVIRRGSGFDTHEADNFRTVTIKRNVDGYFSRLPLAIGSPGGVSSYEGTRFACEGRCVISFDRGLTQLVKRIQMRRGVVLAQAGGRQLECRELDVHFAEGARPEDPLRISRLVAREQVNVVVPGNFRASVGLLATRYDDDDRSTRLTAVMTRVLRLQLWADGGDTSSFLGAHVDDASGAAGIGADQQVRTRIDAGARERVVLRSVRYRSPGPDDPAGTETWELVGQARMERWVQTAVREREPESDTPDFGVRIGRDAIREGWTPPDQPADAPRREVSPWQLSAVLSGAGSTDDTGTGTGSAGHDAGADGDDDDGRASEENVSALLTAPPVHRDILTPTGAIVLGFDLQTLPASVGFGSRSRPVARDLRSLFVHNPGNVPVMELYVDDPGYGVRFFSSRFDVARETLPDGRVQEQTVFAGENPHIIWLTTRNIDPFAMIERRTSITPDDDADADGAPEDATPEADGDEGEGEDEGDGDGAAPDDDSVRGDTADDSSGDGEPVEADGDAGMETGTGVRGDDSAVDDRSTTSDPPSRPGAPHTRGGLPVYRYSIRGDREFTLRQFRHAEDGRPIGFQFLFPGATRVHKSLWTGSGVDAARQAFDCQCRDLELLFDTRFNGELEPARVRARPMIGGEVVIALGRDRCICRGFLYERRPAGPDASPIQRDGRELPVPWIETLHLDGPVDLTLRDRATTGLMPFTGLDGRTVTAAFVRATSEQRVRMRSLLLRSSDAPERIETRSLELLGPCELRALADDPAETPSDETPRLIASLAGDYLRAETTLDEVDGESFERVERLWMAGRVQWDYRLQGIVGSGQRVEYRHDPYDATDPLPRLRLSGNPTVRYVVTAGTRRGVGRVVFPETDNPVERANRYIELVGEPDTIRVRPRAGLEWRPDDGGDLTVFADRIDVGVVRGDPLAPRETMRQRAQRSRYGMLGSADAGPLRFRELRGRGHVVIRQGEQEARGDEFRWIDDMRGRRTGELLGRDPRFTANSPGNINFDLANLDTPADGGVATVYRYRDQDPEHPERRHIITADGRERMRLRLRIPRDDD